MTRQLILASLCLMTTGLAHGQEVRKSPQPEPVWMSAAPLRSEVLPGEPTTTLTGWIIDVDCAADPDLVKEITRHRKSCALMASCARTGYALKVDERFARPPDGHPTAADWIKLDAYGNRLVMETLKVSQRRAGLPVKVTGVVPSPTLRDRKEWPTMKVSEGGLKVMEGRPDDLSGGK